MRRARVDGIWPYMYAGWTRTRQAARVHENEQGTAVWKGGFAAPPSAAWHSALSPVLVSLDLFDPDYVTAQEVSTDLYLINDSWHDADVHVDLLLTRECPEFIPEAPCLDSPVSKWSFDFSVKADSLSKVPVTWQLPNEEGSYWLTARMTGVPGRAVLSQRFVRAITPPKVPEEMKKREFVVLGSDDAAQRFFASHDLQITSHLDNLSPDTHVVVIWDASRLSRDEKRQANSVNRFLDGGGRMVVLATSRWDWPELCDIQIKHDPQFSRVFSYQGVQTTWLTDIDTEWLIRWNGLPGTVAVGALEGAGMSGAEKVLWAKDPGTTVMAVVPNASRKGRLMFSQLDIQHRVDRSHLNYDPVAERVLFSVLSAAAH
jgi:hypothetical protein